MNGYFWLDNVRYYQPLHGSPRMRRAVPKPPVVDITIEDIA